MNPILVDVFRGKTRESFHRGVVCIVDENGNTVAGLGDISQICYPRSTMKLFQHIPLLMSGAVDAYDLGLEEIAIMCGSHNGEELHVDMANSILLKAGLPKSVLQCGPQLPERYADKVDLFSKGLKPHSLHNNCSGKHAGFLLYCHYKGYDLNTYLDPEHPLQKEIKQVCADIYEFNIDDMHLGIDGCSAPVYTIPVYNQALAYKNLVSKNPALVKYHEALETIVKACSDFPYMLGGDKRYCTELIEIASARLIGKTGADGVYCLGLKDRKWGIAIKIDDGKMGPQYTVMQTVLAQLGILSENECKALAKFERTENFNFSNRLTGHTQASRALIDFKFS
jgi:L-asparaginase II